MYSKVQNSNSALTEGKNIDTIKAGIKTLYGGKGNRKYVGISNTILNDARITPDSMRKVPYVAGDNIITNSFGGNVTVAELVGPDNAFQVMYEKVPGGVCSKLGAGAGTGWDYVDVEGVPIKNIGETSVQPDVLASQCATDTGNGLKMNFYSY